MRAASPGIQSLRQRALLAATLTIVLVGALAFIGAPRPALGTSCGQFRCATLTVELGGNGTGVLAVVTSGGALTGTIECHRSGGITSGKCAFSYPLNAVIYLRVVAATGSKTVCNVKGCDTTTSIKHFTLAADMTLSAYGFVLLATPTPTPRPTATHAPTPRPTATHAPTPPPTSHPSTTPKPGATPGATLAGPTNAPAASAAGPSGEPSAQESPTATTGAGGESLPPIATPNNAAGQPASSSDSGGSILIPILVVLLVLLVAGAFLFRKPRAAS